MYVCMYVLFSYVKFDCSTRHFISHIKNGSACFKHFSSHITCKTNLCSRIPTKVHIILTNLKCMFHCNPSYYCAFQKHVNSEVQKPSDNCIVLCHQSSLEDLLENRTLLKWFKRSGLVFFCVKTCRV